MAKVESYTCDQCGTQKQETNHWWVLFINEGSMAMFTWEAAVVGDRVSKSDSLHICSESCAVKKISEFMGGKSCVTAK